MDRQQFINNLKSKVGSTIKTAGDKANKFISIKKIEFEIGKVRGEIERIFKDLGVRIYTTKNNGSEDFGDLDAICNQINMKKEYIKTLEKQIEMINLDDEMKDMPIKYTNKVPEFIKHPESSQNIGVFKFCSECNTGNDVDTDNCKSCGKKI